ncbi:hypothetical protein TcG_09929, partial [Trypanosoma cruzi]
APTFFFSHGFTNESDGSHAVRQHAPLHLMALKLCPNKTRLLLALVEYRQPRANSNNPVRETLLAPGFPRQYGAIDPDATLRRPASPGERSPVGLFAFCWGLGSCRFYSSRFS